MKKIIITSGCVIGAVIIISGALAVFALLKFPEYKQQRNEEQNQMVIDYFCGLCDEDVDEVVVTDVAATGSGSPVPFAEKDAAVTYEYKLSVNGNYHATVWVNWENESFKMMSSDYPGYIEQ